MITIEDDPVCPECGERLKHYDRVQRIVRTKFGKTTWVRIRRLRCSNCGTLHRELPNYIFPYKHYETDVIMGVLEGIVNSDVLGYEDYPCEATMKTWIRTLF